MKVRIYNSVVTDGTSKLSVVKRSKDATDGADYTGPYLGLDLKGTKILIDSVFNYNNETMNDPEKLNFIDLDVFVDEYEGYVKYMRSVGFKVDTYVELRNEKLKELGL